MYFTSINHRGMPRRSACSSEIVVRALRADADFASHCKPEAKLLFDVSSKILSSVDSTSDYSDKSAAKPFPPQKLNKTPKERRL